MRPQILNDTKNEELELKLANSKTGELWVSRFVPLALGGSEHSNAMKIYKRNIFLKKVTLTAEEFNEVFNAINDAGYDEICLQKQDNSVLLFSKYKDKLGSINGIEKVIKKVNSKIKFKYGVSYIDIDRCCIVSYKNWDDGNKPLGIYTIEDLI